MTTEKFIIVSYNLGGWSNKLYYSPKEGSFVLFDLSIKNVKYFDTYGAALEIIKTFSSGIYQIDKLFVNG